MTGIMCALAGAGVVSFNFTDGETITVNGTSSANKMLTCSPAGSWTVTRSGTGEGSPTSGTYGPQTSLAFSVTASIGQLNSNSWAVSVTAGGVTRTCTVQLTANNV